MSKIFDDMVESLKRSMSVNGNTITFTKNDYVVNMPSTLTEEKGEAIIAYDADFESVTLEVGSEMFFESDGWEDCEEFQILADTGTGRTVKHSILSGDKVSDDDDGDVVYTASTTQSDKSLKDVQNRLLNLFSDDEEI